MNRKISECLLQGRDNNFDFIRFVASVGVIFSHSYDLSQNISDPVSDVTHNNYSIGGFSVITFFAISGFLITRSFHRSKSFSDYLSARLLRIYPALLFTVLCTVFIIGPLITTDTLSQYFTSALTWKYTLTAFALRIYETLPGVFNHNIFGHDVNGSLWTLPHEIMCYFLVATFGLLAKKNIKSFLIVAGFVAFILYIDSYVFLKWTFYWDACWFLYGAMFYIFRNYITLNFYAAIGCILLLALNVCFDNFHFVCNPVTGLLITYIIITLSFIKTKHIKNFAKYGDLSYGVYIWGFLTQQVVVLLFGKFNHYYNFLISALIVLPLSFLSWHLVEKKALTLKSIIRHRKRDDLSVSYMQFEQEKSKQNTN